MTNYGRRIGLEPHEKPAYGTVITDPFHPLSRGEVLHLLMNEEAGNKAYDISGHGNHGTLMGGPTWTGSKFGGGLQFDGNGDYVSTPNFTLTFPATIIMWVKPSSGALSTSRTFLSRDGGTTFLWYYIGGGGDCTKIDIYENGPHCATAGLLQENVWQQIVLTFDENGNGHHWYDGSQDLAFSTIQEPTNPFELRIGEWASNDWLGGADNIIAYNRTLTAWEIKTLYHTPFCNLLRIPIHRYYSPAVAAAIMKQFQKANLGSDLYNGGIIT